MWPSSAPSEEVSVTILPRTPFDGWETEIGGKLVT